MSAQDAKYIKQNKYFIIRKQMIFQCLYMMHNTAVHKQAR
jgi:hypothetical protein